MSRFNHCRKKSNPTWATQLSKAILLAVAPTGPALPVSRISPLGKLQALQVCLLHRSNFANVIKGSCGMPPC